MSKRAALILLATLVALSGCTSHRSTSAGLSTDVEDRIGALEKESRTREQAILKLQSEITGLAAERYELKQLLEQTQQTIKGLEDNGAVPAEKPFRFEVSRVDFGFLTCGINLNDKKGDDAIAAYVSLYDQFDSSMKAAGSFRFDLFDLSLAKDQVIQSWRFTPEAAAKYWQRFPACYQFKLPLGGAVRVEKVILKVTFQEAGKKELTATREMKLDLQ